MSRSRRFFNSDQDQSYSGPSDEMLAADAATEMRSMTLLYERWADRIYRYFLLSTGDQVVAQRMMRELLGRLPTELQRFAGQDRSFAGWLFARASEVLWREYSTASKMYRRVSRYVPMISSSGSGADDKTATSGPVLSGFDEIASALRELTPDRREVLGIHFGAVLKTAAAAEALRLPASLLASHVNWAVESLGEHLGATNTRQLSEDLSDVIGRQSVSSEQRQNHFSLIHGVFFGETELESDEPERAPWFEVGALVGVVVLGLIGIWIWGLITEGDTRQHEVASPPVETAGDTDPTPTATAEPEPTEEPVPEEAVAEEDDLSTCFAAEGKSHFDRFIRSYNDADFATIRQMMPQSPVRSTDDDTDFDALFVHGDTEFAAARDVTSFLRERYNDGERWDVLEAYPAEHYRNWQGAAPLEMYQDWKRENPALSMIIVAGLDWSAESEDPDIAQGRVIIDCDEELILSWDLQQYGDHGEVGVTADRLVSVMDDLQPGVSRTIEARVSADSRPDGGALSTWEVTWTEGLTSDGDDVERVDVRTLDGDQVITYVSDGQQWRLDQRGWHLYGNVQDDDAPPLPDEIDLAVPWFSEAAYVLAEFSGDLASVSSMTINEDYSYTTSRGTERRLEIGVQEGVVNSIRVLDASFDGYRILPEMYLLNASRTDELDPEMFDVEMQPPFPELKTDAPRYQVPSSEWQQLRIISMRVGGDQAEESYRIRWNDVDIDLTVRPSRGGLDVDSIPPSIDESWTTATADYRWGQLIWAHRQFTGYPTAALWDDGRYRFDLEVDRDAISTDHDWSLGELINLADALSGNIDAAGDDLDVSGTGGGSGYSRT